MKMIYSWYCILLEDGYSEPEGMVDFSGKPKIGQKFLLPSSGFNEEWQINSVREDDMSFTAIKVDEV